MGRKNFVVFALAVVLVSPRAIAQIPSNTADQEETEKDVGERHRPGTGFSLVKQPIGTLSFSLYATMRYLNSQAAEDSFTNSFGRTSAIDKRNDLQFQKVMLYFKGWLLTEKFRYMTYVWTSNTSQGLGAQVVVGGNLQYKLNKHLDVGAGIGGLPTNRTMIGQWPFWHRQDARSMSEEFFRGSFTTGIWLQGEIVKGVNYKTMLGNNLSQLGIDAVQLDDGFDSWSTSVSWATNNYTDLGTYSDFEMHTKPATFLGAAYTRSNETRQSQPGKDDPENSQIRLSDGTAIFDVGAFAPVAQVLEAKYEMATLFGGIKYKGFALDFDYFFRWLSKFKTEGQISVTEVNDNGFSVQASAMVIPKTLMLYGVGSYINGKYGKPSELNFGINWYPAKSKTLRFNSEIIFADKSPVGYSSYPTFVGSSGTIFMVNLELFF